MMTNGVCSVFRADGSNTICTGVYPCMWQETKAYETKKYGEENADSAAVYIPYLKADIKKGDFIFFGKVEEPSEKELYNALNVHSITVNNFGSADMQHIKLGVR